MAGIYIHVPYCIQKCGYCDFYSIIRLSSKQDFITSLCKEIELRHSELVTTTIETIYFGGGTPSLLKIPELESVMNALKTYFSFDSIKEITIEVNPDDVTFEYMLTLRQLGFNRVSMGIQSFNNKILTFMNRRHSVENAIKAVYTTKKAGFENISIDLIYGIPNMTMDEWINSINEAIKLDVQHISAYHLTFEPNTPFYTKLKRNEINEINDEVSVSQYKILVNELRNAGYIDYEISNFCKPNLESKHNSNYWTGKNYLGFGPSAHSYINKTRSWNVSSIEDYINLIERRKSFSKQEILTEKDIFNESMMLGLRTQQGVSIAKITTSFSCEILEFFNKELMKNIALKNVYKQDNFIKINKDRKFLTDKIISDFFIV